MKTQSRREFIINSAKTTGVVIVTTTIGKGAMFAKTPGTNDNKFPDFSCGDENKNSIRILIAYASKSGSTVEVAKSIGDTLCNKGFNVETKWIKAVNDINKYDAVIIGSPIIYENWMPEVRTFVKDNKDILKTIPVSYFITCLTLSRNENEAKQKSNEYSDKLCELVPEVKPISVGRFGGVLDYSKIPFIDRVLLKIVMMKNKVKEGDYRDWNKIRLWAENIEFKMINNKNSKNYEKKA